ncbi:caspase-8-like [Pelodytes ibericus]
MRSKNVLVSGNGRGHNTQYSSLRSKFVVMDPNRLHEDKNLRQMSISARVIFNMSFKLLLHDVSEQLDSKDLQDMIFLCGNDLTVIEREKITTPLELFTRMQKKVLIKEDDLFYLKCLLHSINRIDLLMEKLKTTDKELEDIRQETKSANHTFAYRYHLYTIAENLTEVEQVKFLLDQKNGKLEKAENMMQIFLEMEKARILSEDNLGTLKCILGTIKRMDILQKVQEFEDSREKAVASDLEKMSLEDVILGNYLGYLESCYVTDSMEPTSDNCLSITQSHATKATTPNPGTQFRQRISQLLHPSSDGQGLRGQLEAGSIGVSHQRVPSDLDCRDTLRVSTVLFDRLHTVPSLTPPHLCDYDNPLVGLATMVPVPYGKVHILPQASSSLPGLDSGPMKVVGRDANVSKEAVHPIQEVSMIEKHLDTYELKRDPHGWCVIINNLNFAKARSKKQLLKDRDGTVKDAEAIRNVFKARNYIIEEHCDLTGEEMLQIMEKYGNENHNEKDSFVCFILSHGELGIIYGTDGETVPIKTLKDFLNGQHCKSLVGKPKIFFIQACQGEVSQNPVPYEEDCNYNNHTDDSKTSHLPVHSDFLTAYATVEDYTSLRNTLLGSVYIQHLCKALQDPQFYNAELQKILTDLNNKVSGEDYYVTENSQRQCVKQMPSFKSELRKILILPLPAQTAQSSQ